VDCDATPGWPIHVAMRLAVSCIAVSWDTCEAHSHAISCECIDTGILDCDSGLLPCNRAAIPSGQRVIIRVTIRKSC